jgi:hypothetical protein
MRRCAVLLLCAALLGGFAGAGEEDSAPLTPEEHAARVAELRQRLAIQDARIQALEERAAAQQEDGVELIPRIKIQARFGPNLLYWRDRLWELGDGNAGCASCGGD